MPILNNLTVNEIGGGTPKQYDMAIVTTRTTLENDNFGSLFDSLQSGNISVDFSSVQSIVGDYICENMFGGNTAITGTVDLSSLTTINGEGACSGMFTSCENMPSINLSSLTTINGDYACSAMFDGCESLTSIDLSSLTSINGDYASDGMFNNCTGVTSVDVSSLTQIGASAGITFSGCSMTTLSFPSLTTVGDYGLASFCTECAFLETVSFGALDPSLCGVDIFGDNEGAWYAFDLCPALTEIHFPQGTQAAISQWTGYADKWGASNATIYFDL